MVLQALEQQVLPEQPVNHTSQMVVAGHILQLILVIPRETLMLPQVQELALLMSLRYM
jgi:hypothetical protein